MSASLEVLISARAEWSEQWRAAIIADDSMDEIDRLAAEVRRISAEIAHRTR